MHAHHHSQLLTYSATASAELTASPCRSLDDSTSMKYSDSGDLTATAPDSSLLLVSPTTPTRSQTLATNELQYRDLDQSTNTTTGTPPTGTIVSIAENPAERKRLELNYKHCLILL